MTTRITKQGKILIPKPVRERQGIGPGDAFHLFALSNGDLLLRRFRAPKKSLVWHLRQLQGLQIERNRETLREVRW